MGVCERLDFALSTYAALPEDEDGPLVQILSDIIDDCCDELMSMEADE